MAAVASVAKGELCEFAESCGVVSDVSIASAKDRARCKQRAAVRCIFGGGCMFEHSRHSERASPAADAKLSRGLNAAKTETMIGTVLQEKTAQCYNIQLSVLGCECHLN